jgi:hypothetical protein
VGTAYIQELRFNKYCERLQSMVEEDFNKEFKLFLQSKGANIDFSMFDLRLTPPQNFAAYRQAELDNNRISTFTSMAAVPYISNRFALQRFLGLSEEEIAENERLWQEENDENLTDLISDDMAGEMRGAGLSGADLAGDLGGLEDELGGDAGGVDGGTGDAPETNTEAELGGAEADTAQTI